MQPYPPQPAQPYPHYPPQHPYPPRPAPPYPQQPHAPQAPAPLQQPPALPPGTILLDRYLIQGYINGGGFGHIYKAQDNALGYRRAIKEAFYQDPYTRRQFQLEAEFLLNSRHPNLVSAYAVFEQMGRLYLVMDYVDGWTLEELAIDHIRRFGRTLPESYVLDAVIPVCGALTALHSAPVPVIHRDVKPANIKMTRRGVPVLIDLGLAKLHQMGTQTIGAALAFTPGYAPPEQYRASGATDARTDIYGMGATLFYLLTGYQPTEAPARLGAQAVPAVRQLNPHVSELAAQVVIRAMELEPERRQQSAAELERDLRAVRAALGTVPDAAGPAKPAAGATIVADETRQHDTLVCQHCAGSNPPFARHCMRCGWRLVEDAPPLDPAPDGAERATPSAAAPPRPTDGDRSNAPLPDWLRAAVPPDAVRPASPPASDLPLPKPTSAADDLARQGNPADAPPAPPPVEGSAAAPHRGPVPAAMWLPAAPIPHAPPFTPAPGNAAPPAHAAPHAPRWRVPRLPPAAQQRMDRVVGQVGHGARRVAAFVVAAAEPVQRSVQRWLPTPRRWQAQTLSAPAPLDEREVRLGVAAIMALVLAIGTLVAVRFPWALVAALPALALGHWCLRESAAPDIRPVPEARWLAVAALVITYLCLGVYTIVTLIHVLHR